MCFVVNCYRRFHNPGFASALSWKDILPTAACRSQSTRDESSQVEFATPNIPTVKQATIGARVTTAALTFSHGTKPPGHWPPAQGKQSLISSRTGNHSRSPSQRELRSGLRPARGHSRDTPRHATPRHGTANHATPRQARPHHGRPGHATAGQATAQHEAGHWARPRQATPRHSTGQARPGHQATPPGSGSCTRPPAGRHGRPRHGRPRHRASGSCTRPAATPRQATPRQARHGRPRHQERVVHTGAGSRSGRCTGSWARRGNGPANPSDMSPLSWFSARVS